MHPVIATSTSAASSAVDVEIPHLIRTYRSGCIERLHRANFVPPKVVDIATGVSSKDVVFNPALGLSVRLYLPPTATSLRRKKHPLLFYFHGGGFCTGSPFSSVYHTYLNSLVSNAGVVAVSVDYRLAPEHPLPAAYVDSWEALSWAAACADGRLLQEPWLADSADLDRIYLAGDSAGANIAHNLATRLGEMGKKVEGLVLVHPLFWGRERMGREGEDREGVLFKAKNADELWPLVFPGSTMGLDDPRINPTGEGAPSLGRLGCRRVLVCVAGIDLLRERGRAYYEKLVGSGWVGEAKLFESKGKDHGFHLKQRRKSEAVELMQRLVSFIRFKISNQADAETIKNCMDEFGTLSNVHKFENGRSIKILSNM